VRIGLCPSHERVLVADRTTRSGRELEDRRASRRYQKAEQIRSTEPVVRSICLKGGGSVRIVRLLRLDRWGADRPASHADHDAGAEPEIELVPL
jgi:hypothetical protein